MHLRVNITLVNGCIASLAPPQNNGRRPYGFLVFLEKMMVPGGILFGLETYPYAGAFFG